MHPLQNPMVKTESIGLYARMMLAWERGDDAETGRMRSWLERYGEKIEITDGSFAAPVGSVSPMLCPTELAKHIGIGADVIRRLYHAGKLPGHRIGGRIYFRMEDVQKYFRGPGDDAVQQKSVPTKWRRGHAQEKLWKFFTTPLRRKEAFTLKEIQKNTGLAENTVVSIVKSRSDVYERDKENRTIRLRRAD